MGEEQLIAWLRSRLGPPGPGVLVGAGVDDCALLDVADATRLALTTDAFLEGTHFAAEAAPEAVGWKAMAASISDLAASGCEPRWALIALGLRADCGHAYAQRLGEGLIACAQRYAVSIVGGDTTSGKGPTSLTVTAVGVPFPAGPVTRAGARPGDVIAVTGRLGGSLSARHLRPEPRVPEMRALLAQVQLHASMDISDGLALDLSRLLEASHCGALLEAAAIPIHPDAREASRTTGRTPLAHALGDGEDFELLFTLRPDAWESVRAAWPPAPGLAPITRIGTVRAEAGMGLLHRDGREAPLPPTGYTHAF